MSVAFSCRVAAGAVWSGYLKTRARQVLQAVGRRRTELSLSLIGDVEMRELNRSYRQKDQPTDVLAFPLYDPPVPEQVACLGDVVISIETARVAARQQRRPLARCLDALLIHGVLHLLGYDHEISVGEARRMARRAREVRGRIGAMTVPPRAVVPARATAAARRASARPRHPRSARARA